jgi:cystathionine beta-lyase
MLFAMRWLFKLGYSWGGPMSLVVPYDLATMRSGWPVQLKKGTLVRFSVGLESAADLQADLATGAGQSSDLSQCLPE